MLMLCGGWLLVVFEVGFVMVIFLVGFGVVWDVVFVDLV